MKKFFQNGKYIYYFRGKTIKTPNPIGNNLLKILEQVEESYSQKEIFHCDKKYFSYNPKTLEKFGKSEIYSGIYSKTMSNLLDNCDYLEKKSDKKLLHQRWILNPKQMKNVKEPVYSSNTQKSIEIIYKILERYGISEKEKKETINNLPLSCIYFQDVIIENSNLQTEYHYLCNLLEEEINKKIPGRWLVLSTENSMLEKTKKFSKDNNYKIETFYFNNYPSLGKVKEKSSNLFMIYREEKGKFYGFLENTCEKKLTNMRVEDNFYSLRKILEMEYIARYIQNENLFPSEKRESKKFSVFELNDSGIFCLKSD